MCRGAWRSGSDCSGWRSTAPAWCPRATARSRRSPPSVLRTSRLEQGVICHSNWNFSSQDTGFYRLGHQKRLTLGIRRLKEVSRLGRGYSQPAPQPHYISQEVPSLAGGGGSGGLALKSGQFSSFHQPAASCSSPFSCRKVVMVEHHHHHQPDLTGSVGSVGSVGVPEPMAPLQYPLYKQSLGVAGPQFPPGSPRFTPRAAGGLGHPPQPQSQYRMMRSYDDADIVRRSDNSILLHEAANSRPHMGGETLPRLKTGTLKPKPVAKIIANTRSNVTLSQEDIDRDWEEVQVCPMAESNVKSIILQLSLSEIGGNTNL